MPEEEIVQKVVKYLEENLVNDLNAHIKKSIRDIVHEEFEAVFKRFSRLEKTMDVWKSDLDQDREDISQIRRTMGDNNTLLEEVRKSVGHLPKKINITVEDAIEDTVSEEITKAVTNTFEIVGKKVKVISKPKTLLGFFKFLKFW